MAGLQPLVAEFAFKASVVTNIGGGVLLLTDHGAERQRIVAVDLERPQPENWRQIVPEAADTLRSAHHFGDQARCAITSRTRDRHYASSTSTHVRARHTRSWSGLARSYER